MFNKYLLLEKLQENLSNENFKKSFINGLKYYKSYFISNFEKEQYLKVHFDKIIEKIDDKITDEYKNEDETSCNINCLILIKSPADSKELRKKQANLAVFMDAFIAGNAIFSNYITYLFKNNSDDAHCLFLKMESIKQSNTDVENIISQMIENVSKGTESTIKVTEQITRNIKIPFLNKKDSLNLIKYQYEKYGTIPNTAVSTDSINKQDDLLLTAILSLDEVAMALNLKDDYNLESADDLVSMFNNKEEIYEYLENKYGVRFQ